VTVLSRLIDAGVPPGADPIDAKPIRVTNIASLAGAGSIGSWVPIAAANGFYGVAVENALATAAFLGAIEINRRGHRTAAALTAIGTALLQLLFALHWFGAASQSQAFFATLILLPYLTFPRAQRRVAHAAALPPAALWLLATLFAEQLPQRLPMVSADVNAAVNVVLVSGILVWAASGFLTTSDRALDEVDAERTRADALLRNVLPEGVADELKAQPDSRVARRHPAVSVLFADLVGFTPLSATMQPADTVDLLNEVFSAFDAICQRHGVEKIKTIGDGYMAVAGAPDGRPDHAAAALAAAREMLTWIDEAPAADGLQLRVGLDAGTAVSAIVGRTRFHWDLWSDTVNTAARMESHGVPGRVHVTRAFRELLGDDVACEPRGTIEVKGKGPMETWLIAP
jgi:adenylate cyclase